MTTNCVNCGAPLNKESFAACPYCGTYNLNIAAIDLNNRAPIGLILRTGNAVIKCMAIPDVASVSNEYESTDVFGRYGEKITSYVIRRNVGIEVSFTAVPDSSDNLFTMEIYDEGKD